MHRYRIDLSIGMPGYTDTDEWRLQDGWFKFMVNGEIKAQYPELSVKAIRRTGAELDLVTEYSAKEPSS
jgi:hypothetical protein